MPCGKKVLSGMTLLGAAVFMKNLTLNEDWMMAGHKARWIGWFFLPLRGVVTMMGLRFPWVTPW